MKNYDVQWTQEQTMLTQKLIIRKLHYDSTKSKQVAAQLLNKSMSTIYKYCNGRLKLSLHDYLLLKEYHAQGIKNL